MLESHDDMTSRVILDLTPQIRALTSISANVDTRWAFALLPNSVPSRLFFYALTLLQLTLYLLNSHSI